MFHKQLQNSSSSILDLQLCKTRFTSDCKFYHEFLTSIYCQYSLIYITSLYFNDDDGQILTETSILT